MKKSLAHAVSKGVVLLVLAQAGGAALADGVEYKVEWDAAAERYRVYMKPDATPSPDLTLSAQVTLRVPHVDGANKFTISDLTSHHAPDAIWSPSSKVEGPTEDPTVDYISFTPNISNSQAFGLQAGVEQEIFSFQNSSSCTGIVEIMDNKTDPFNQPEGATDNSAGTNPGNEFSSITWSGTNDFLGIYGKEADCRTTSGSNNNPVANNDSTSVVEDSSVTISVLGNDTDADGDKLSIDAVTQGANGAVSISGEQIIYEPDATYSGSDSFTYTVSDGNGGSSTATVSVTVTPKTTGGNSAPVANNDIASVTEGQTVTINVLSNDTDSEGDNLTISGKTDGDFGSVQLLGGSSLTYTSVAGSAGTDTFTYTISDGKGGSSTATVTVTIKAGQSGSCSQPPVSPAVNKVYYRVAWDQSDERYHVYMYPGGEPSPDLSQTSQVTLKMPHSATVGDAFEVDDLQSEVANTNWSQSSHVTSPDEDKTSDYVSFNMTADDYQAFNWTNGQEIEVFSFANKGACLGEVALMNNSTDPFNQLPNSVGTNPGNQFTNLGWGAATDNNYMANYGCPAVCTQGSVDDDDDKDGLTNAEEVALGTNPGSADSDGDGVSDAQEIGSNKNDPIDTDSDGTIDALDADDDGDGVPTINENYNGGSPEDDDTDNDGTPDYLDRDDDGDGIFSIFENYDNDSTPVNDDTDNDGTPDYLDIDDDNDGTLTASELPDLDNDGSPDDALDSDQNGVPDYLQRALGESDRHVAIPTLTQWAQILLSLLLGLIAMRRFLGNEKS